MASLDGFLMEYGSSFGSGVSSIFLAIILHSVPLFPAIVESSQPLQWSSRPPHTTFMKSSLTVLWIYAVGSALWPRLGLPHRMALGLWPTLDSATLLLQVTAFLDSLWDPFHALWFVLCLIFIADLRSFRLVVSLLPDTRGLSWRFLVYLVVFGYSRPWSQL
ncbi:hypothetical protein SUGI_0187400 [Cryptomeria japonica]|nr:hypothetical protein SUGI_0187400 [Cryptomeria japonica]